MTREMILIVSDDLISYRALVRIIRSVGADLRFLISLVSFINKDIEFLIKSVGSKAPFHKSVGAAAPTAPTLTRALLNKINGIACSVKSFLVICDFHDCLI